MDIFDTLVTDRTADDVSRAAAIRNKYAALGDWSGLTAEEQGALSRGYYTRHDLNRVESAVWHIAERLREHSYHVASLSVKTDWTPQDFFTQPELLRILGNIQSLRNAFHTLPATPPTPRDIRAHSDANAVEQILYDLWVGIRMMMRNLIYAPRVWEPIMGEGITL
jgi:hypothetical protein